MEQSSPFPGMDPWLEEHWGDVHHTIIQHARRLIGRRLPPGLFAAVEESVYVVGYDTEPRRRWRVKPDTGVFESPRVGARRARRGEPTSLVVAEPVRLRIIEERVVQGHIEVRKIGGAEPLVTAIEIVSPTNKSDKRGRLAYLEKRESFYDAGVNVVEVDLIRAGEPLIGVPWRDLSEELRAPYNACVRRGRRDDADDEVEFYPLRLRERLPAIWIPLRPDDDDVPLDLQATVDEAYDVGEYGDRLDYSKSPRPPLTADDAAWAAEMVKAARG